jgi:hypothetical protein
MKQTIRILKSAVILLLAGLLSWQTCVAQVDPWERVNLVEPGKRLAVKLHSGRSVNGKMEAWSTDGVAVRRGKDRVVQVAKSDVAQVATVSGLSRGRKALYGTPALVGGTGLIMGTCGADPNAYCGGGLGVANAVGVGVMLTGLGLLVWALFPQHKEVLYTAPGSGPSKK